MHTGKLTTVPFTEEHLIIRNHPTSILSDRFPVHGFYAFNNQDFDIRHILPHRHQCWIIEGGLYKSASLNRVLFLPAAGECPDQTLFTPSELHHLQGCLPNDKNLHVLEVNQLVSTTTFVAVLNLYYSDHILCVSLIVCT